MKQAKTCIQCLKEYTPNNAAFSEAWSRRQFCSMRCGILFRRRSRNKAGHSAETLAEIERQGIILKPESSSISSIGISRDESPQPWK